MPKRNLLPYKTLVLGKELKYERLEILKRLVEGKVDILITSEEGVLEKYQEKSTFIKDIVDFKVGKEYERDKLIARLIKLGYEKVEILEGKGQFSIRGNIIDIYLTTEKTP